LIFFKKKLEPQPSTFYFTTQRHTSLLCILEKKIERTQINSLVALAYTWAKLRRRLWVPRHPQNFEKQLLEVNFYPGYSSNFQTYKRKAPHLVCFSFATELIYGSRAPARGVYVRTPRAPRITCSPSSDGVARTYADGCISTVALWTAILESGWTPSAGDALAVPGNVAAAATSAASSATAIAAALPIAARCVAGLAIIGGLRHGLIFLIVVLTVAICTNRE
jgi:hypothetical protein